MASSQLDVKMSAAYDSIVKDFQTNLASFVNVSCLTNKYISSPENGLFFLDYSLIFPRIFLGCSNPRNLYTKLGKDHGKCGSKPNNCE